MIQFVELCRLCAQNKRNKLDLFAKEDEETKTLLGNILVCLSVNITKDDMLPKMICSDCQKSIQQFNIFRVKCLKAEERLIKMLSCTVTNKILLTRIKEECLETEFNEHHDMQPESPRHNEVNTSVIAKPVKNVKLEVNKLDEETVTVPVHKDTCSDLVQIISDEIFNQNGMTDIKQPVIEVISENFVSDLKHCDIIPAKTNHSNDEIILESNRACQTSPSHSEDNYSHALQVHDVADPTAVIEIKIQEPECRQPDITEINKQDAAGEGCNTTGNNGKCKKARKRRYIVESDEEIDSKYLFLGENEECNIDFEEMDALIKKNMNPNIRFDCKNCKKTFKFFKCLKKHRTIHQNEPESFICDLCRSANAKCFEFSSLSCLKNHVQRKHMPGVAGKFTCSMCSRTLMSEGELNAHFRKVHDNSGASCRVCDKTFKTKTRLTDHLKVHRQDRPYVCDHCGQSFKWNNSLKVHIASHKQEKNFLCSECGKKFSTKKNLLEHLNIHTGTRPYVCQSCHASFTQFSAYSKHLYTHNEEMKLFKCDKCEKNFSHNYLLKQHTLLHSGTRPFSCTVCSNAFKSRSDLCTHLKIHQEKQYPCSVCGLKFSRSKTLTDHMVRHTGVKHVCPVPGCGKSYTQRFPLTKHFCKYHPSLKIINRLGGKKTHLADKVINDLVNYPDPDFIRYDYKPKHE